MKKLVSSSGLFTLTTLGLLLSALVHPANAARLGSPTHTPTLISANGLLTRPAAASHVNGVPPPGSHVRDVVPNRAMPHPAAVVGPITTRVPIGGLRSIPFFAPGLYNLQASAAAVTVKWFDRSNNELGFKIYRRDRSGKWQVVYQVPTRDMAGGGDYVWVDTSTDLSGQCYMIASYNNTSIAYTKEQCTVRPDPSRFPQAVAGAAPQWYGLSSTNDGTGNLVNENIQQHLRYGHETWGVNLTYADSSLWRVEAQGGPHLMKGQAVALKVWGGGWLKYGHQTWGVDLQLSATPVYEWYAIGMRHDPSEQTYAGFNLADGDSFALWNSSAQAYLVHGYETWGISLKWYKVGGGSSPTPTPFPTHGVKTEQVLNCSVEQHPVEVFIADQTVGGGFVDKGMVNEQYGASGCPAPGSVPLTFSPLSGHQYLLVATDKTLPACDGLDDPEDDACRKMTAQFVGDANGFTRTDIVDIGTQITP
jgi:hypothetical protein